jgi:SpoVK/Ycf46/Vps4 family AAA+-type ATPase
MDAEALVFVVDDDASLRRVLQAVETVAPTDATVLLAGETGTGKELIARAIHMLSRRRAAGVDRPYGGLGGKPKPALRAPIGMVRSGDTVAIMDFHEVRLEHGGIKVGM